MDFATIITYADLYDRLTKNNYTFDEVISSKPNGNIEPQECLFKLFGKLELYKNLNRCNNLCLEPCIGNYNKSTIAIANIQESMLDNLSHGGDCADMVFISGDTIYPATSKNISNVSVGKLDIADIILHYNNLYKTTYPNIKLIIVIRDKLASANASSHKYTDIINDSIIINHADLKLLYNIFMLSYKNIDCVSLYANKHPMICRFHQELTIYKTMNIFQEHSKVVWGHIPRSGKSYIMAQLIHKTYEPKRNYIIITTAPNETIEQYEQIFNIHVEFTNYNVVNTRTNAQFNKNKSNIIIVSLQKLKIDNKSKSVDWIYDIKYHDAFFDECHLGGSNELTKYIIKKLMTKNHIYITATYDKPVLFYKVSPEHRVMWDLEDVKLCSNLTSANIEILKNKHGDIIVELIKKYTIPYIQQQYLKYPSLHLLSLSLKDDIEKDIINATADNEYGLSLHSIMMLKQDKLGGYLPEFQDESRVLTLCENIFGKQTNITSNALASMSIINDTNSIIKQAEKIAIHNNSRWFSVGKPLTILLIMPVGKGGSVELRCKTFAAFLSRITTNFIITYSTSASNTSIKTVIKEAEQRAINQSKIGVIAMTGRQGLLGITYEKCDLVICLDNLTGDTKWQAMFRCMTEAPGKAIGVFVSLSIQNNINTIFEYALNIASKNKNDIKKTIQYMYEQRLITLHCADWFDTYFKTEQQYFEILAQKTLEMISNEPINNVNSIFKSLSKLNLDISDESNLLIKEIFYGNTRGTIKKLTKLLENEKKERVKEGINENVVKHADQNANEKANEKANEQGNDDTQINIINDIFKYIAPMMCFLTYDNDNYDFGQMCLDIKRNKELSSILYSAIGSWCKAIPADLIAALISIYDTYLCNNNLFNSLINILKQGIKSSMRDHDKLSQLIDEYLIPHQNDKEQNAEISTPYGLRQEMLDTIDNYAPHIWTGIKYRKDGILDVRPARILEPCCGKGGFLIDCVSRLKKGLAQYFDNDEELYQCIVEDCIYFADINPLNIFICRLLLDPYNKYKLNYYLGDTLEQEFPCKFDLVVGNPPYQRGIGHSRNNSIYGLFITFAMKNIRPNGYLLFITPSSWMSLNNNNTLFKLLIKDNDLLYLNIEGAKHYFPKIGSTFSWYLCRKTNHPKILTEVRCLYKKVFYNSRINLKSLDFCPLLCHKHSISILLKIINNDDKLPIATNTKLHAGIAKNKKYLSKIQTDIFKHKVIHTPTQTFYTDMEHPLNNIPKVFIPLTTYYENILVDDCIMTQGCYFILCDTMRDAENMKLYLLSDVFRFVVKICRWGNFNNLCILRQLTRNLPQLTQAEQTFINSVL